MTEYANELVGRKIQIKDLNTGKLIANTRITTFDSAKKTVKISASGLSSPGCPGGQCADLWRAQAARILRKYE